jgi:hypothetical protein
LKRIGLFFLLAVGVVLAYSRTPVSAITASTSIFLEETVTIIVTPTPGPTATPLAFVNPLAPSVSAASMVAASGNSTYDVAPISLLEPQTLLAQATPQGPIPVTFKAIANPNAKFLHSAPNSNPTATNQNNTLLAGYGTTVFPCVYQVFTDETTSYKLTDWAFNTSTGAGAGTYPLFNSPTISEAAWEAEGVTTSFSNFANDGSPGESDWNGTANVSQQHCFDWKVTVPTSLAPGTYTATVQYNLLVGG